MARQRHLVIIVCCTKFEHFISKLQLGKSRLNMNKNDDKLLKAKCEL